MAKTHIRVTQRWQRHFAAPIALMRLARGTNNAVAADEDGGVYLLNESGTVLLSRQMPWLPVAIAVTESADRFAAVSSSGMLLVFDRNGNIVDEARIVFRPTWLEMSPTGERVAFADGAGKVGTLDFSTHKTDYLDSTVPYHYVRLVGPHGDFLAVGQYGQILYQDQVAERQWQKDYRCHTRQPVASGNPIAILIPSPYYGVISLSPSGSENGLFEVPGSPKALAVTSDGGRIFVVNEENELIIFESAGKVLFRQPLGAGVLAIDCDPEGASFTAVMTTGALEHFSISRMRGGDAPFLEFAIERPEGGANEPEVLWKTKVFSALGGVRGGQLAVTPGARYVGLLDVEGYLRIFDQTGKQTAEAERLHGRQGALKASRSTDFFVAASSDNLLALDIRGYRQRRLSLKNEWATHFDISPKGIFFTVADFFRGVSLFDASLERTAYLETSHDVVDVAVDGKHHVLLTLSNGSLAFYTENGGVAREIPQRDAAPTATASLGQGFIAAFGPDVEAFDSDGCSAWKLELPGEASFIQATPAGIVVANADGDAFVLNAHGAVVNKMLKRGTTKYFAQGGGSKAIISIEQRGRLLTARSTEAGVLWRKEMEDDILAMEVSPDGSCAAIITGVFLCVLSTKSGAKGAPRQTYLEI